MKRIIAATAILATIGTSSFAMVSQDQLPANVRLQITQMVPDADLEDLTTSQLSEINSLFSNRDNLRAGNDPAGHLKVILAWD